MDKELNTDTAEVIEHIDKAGGDGITSFDELDAVEMYAKSEKAEAKKEAKAEKPKKEKAQTPEEEKADESEGDEVEAKAKDAEEKQDEESLPDVRTFKLKNGKDEVELRADTIVPVKVDGKEQNLPFEEVVRRASGDIAIETRFNQLAAEKRSFESDKQVIDSFVAEVFEAAKDNPIAGLLKAAEKAGMDPVQYEMALYDEMAKRGREWDEMSDEQRLNYKLQRENESLQTKFKMDQQRQVQEKQMKDLSVEVDRIKAQHGLSQEDFVAGYQDLLVEWQKGTIPQEITPQLVADYLLDQRKIATAKDIITGIDPEILAQNSSAINDLVELMYAYPTLDANDFKDIVSQHYKVKKPAQQISDKLRKGKPDLVEPKQARQPQYEPLSFDEL